MSARNGWAWHGNEATSLAFQAARAWVFEGVAQPNGYTEPLLHRFRARQAKGPTEPAWAVRRPVVIGDDIMDENDKTLPAQAPAEEGEVRGQGARDLGAPHDYDTDAQNLGDFKQETNSPKPDRGKDGAKGGMR